MNPYKITNQGSKVTKNLKYKQTTLQIHRNDLTEINYEDFKAFVTKLLTKKKSNQQILIRGLSKLGWLTYLSYNQIALSGEEDDYLDGRISNTANTFKLTQFQIIIMEKQ
jgi:hypothetical protein